MIVFCRLIDSKARDTSLHIVYDPRNRSQSSFVAIEQTSKWDSRCISGATQFAATIWEEQCSMLDTPYIIYAPSCHICTECPRSRVFPFNHELFAKFRINLVLTEDSIKSDYWLWRFKCNKCIGLTLTWRNEVNLKLIKKYYAFITYIYILF